MIETSVAQADDALTKRRFSGVSRLYGAAGFEALRAAHVVVVGIGGVGSWAAESLARSGVGALTLIDLDVVAESNLNRQAHASLANLGRNKVEAMRDRILGFAPECALTLIDDFVTQDNVSALFADHSTLVIDGIDQVRAKAALVAHCVAHGQRIIVCGGAGGKTDATSVRAADLTRTTNDALLSKLRADLRKFHGFPRGEKKFGVTAIYSEAQQSGSAENAAAGLACAGYGSVMHMTAAIGLAAAGEALRLITKQTPLPATTTTTTKTTTTLERVRQSPN